MCCRVTYVSANLLVITGHGICLRRADASQAGINGLLAKEVSSVLNAATVSFLVGTLALLALALWWRDAVSIDTHKGLHWWHWAGGLLGAFLFLPLPLLRHALAPYYYGSGFTGATEQCHLS